MYFFCIILFPHLNTEWCTSCALKEILHLTLWMLMRQKCKGIFSGVSGCRRESEHQFTILAWCGPTVCSAHLCLSHHISNGHTEIWGILTTDPSPNTPPSQTSLKPSTLNLHRLCWHHLLSEQWPKIATGHFTYNSRITLPCWVWLEERLLEPFFFSGRHLTKQ